MKQVLISMNSLEEKLKKEKIFFMLLKESYEKSYLLKLKVLVKLWIMFMIYRVELLIYI